MIKFRLIMKAYIKSKKGMDLIMEPTISRTVVLKICLIGSYGTGKTSLRVSYMGNRHNRNYLPTVGTDFSVKEVVLDSKKFQLLIWDVSGETRFESIRSLYFQGVYGVLLVFDQTRRESFNDLDQWIHDIEISTQTQGVPVVVLGNKSDLILSDLDKKVSREEIEAYISGLNDRYEGKFEVRYVETSALSGDNVNEAFIELIREIMEWLPKRKRI